MSKYIVITPCKNEGDNLPNLIGSMIAQNVKPVIWMIVDDGSTDNTPQITQDAAEKYEWIHVIRLNEVNERDLGLHLAGVMKKGFDFAISYCKEQKIDYTYIGNIDGDLTIPSTFFENLIQEFERDVTLGIASGGVRLTRGNKFVHVKGLPKDEPSGGHMLIRRKCFEDCGGIPISYSLDSVLKAKARIKGWKTKRFEDNIATEIRDVFNAEGYWKGYIQYGKSNYYLNFHPFHVFAKGIICCFIKPYYIGLAYIWGYFVNFILKKEQIDDSEIRHYFWNKWKTVYQRRLFRRVNQ